MAKPAPPQHRVENTRTASASIAEPGRSTVGAKPVAPGGAQHYAGNLAIQRLLEARAIQARLAVGEPDDAHEREAERIAHQVMNAPSQRVAGENGPTPQLARTITPVLQRTSAAAPRSPDTGPGFESRLGTSGQPLPSATRSFMESRFGANFGGVRLHSDTNAAQLNRAIGAEAFTHGSSIYLGDGKSNVASRDGTRLLAHELTHTIQQGATGPGANTFSAGAVMRSSIVQRQPAPAAPPVATPTPAPVAGVTPPGAPSPVPGATKAETDPVELPLVARRFPVTITSTERRLKLTNEDFSEFELFKGELTTGDIPIPEIDVSVKLTARSQEGIRLADASIGISPIEAEIDAAQVAAAREKGTGFGAVGAAVGGIAGGLVGAGVGILLGPLGMIKGAGKGAEAGGLLGGQAAESVANIFKGDRQLMATLTGGTADLSISLAYSPELILALSVTGFSWLADVETTLLTNLTLTGTLGVDFKGTSITLRFLDGRLAPSEFEINSEIRPFVKATLDADAQILASLVILPFLRGEKPKVGEDEAIEAFELTTVPFHLFTLETGELDLGGSASLTAMKASPTDIRRKRTKAQEGKMAGGFKKGLQKPKPKPNTAAAGKAKPEDKGGPHTGLTKEDAIPLQWWKPFDDYVKELHLPASEFGTALKARRFPNHHYKNEKRGIDLSLGVSNWPYEGMPLRKKQNERDSAKTQQFKEDLAQHGVDLDKQAPGTQIDHVIDLVFHLGYDREENFWPLDAKINERAGSKWSFGEYLVEWAEEKGGPLIRTTPAHVPVGRWFVIVGKPKRPL